MGKIFCFIGIIAGAALIFHSFSIDTSEVPDRKIENPARYIGGDAYNYQIEASLRAGETAGVAAYSVEKSIYTVGGAILLFCSLIAFGILIDLSKEEPLPQARKIKEE